MQFRKSHVEEMHWVRNGCVCHRALGTSPPQHCDVFTNAEAPQWTFLSKIWDDPFPGPEDSAVLKRPALPIAATPSLTSMHTVLSVCVKFLPSLQDMAQASLPPWSLPWSSPPSPAFRAAMCTPSSSVSTFVWWNCLYSCLYPLHVGVPWGNDSDFDIYNLSTWPRGNNW